MSVKTELSQNLASDSAPASPLDTVKLIFALLLLVGGIVAFYWFESQFSAPVRVLGMLGVVGASLAIIAFTRVGRALLGFFSDSSIELRKVVWPSRQETFQTTILVFIVVVIVGLLLWIMDGFFGFAVRWLFGH